MKYVAFLRGINVGGHKPLKMDALRTAFESLSFQDVTTVLASGNVLFESRSAGTSTLAKKIERRLATIFKHDIGVIVRTLAEIQSLADAKPFKRIKVTPRTGLYVTFLPEGLVINAGFDVYSGAITPKNASKTRLPVFEIVRVSDGEVCSAVTRSADGQTTDFMAVIEKLFGRKVTTRNWNTIARILSG